MVWHMEKEKKRLPTGRSEPDIGKMDVPSARARRCPRVSLLLLSATIKMHF